LPVRDQPPARSRSRRAQARALPLAAGGSCVLPTLLRARSQTRDTAAPARSADTDRCGARTRDGSAPRARRLTFETDPEPRPDPSVRDLPVLSRRLFKQLQDSPELVGPARSSVNP